MSWILSALSISAKNPSIGAFMLVERCLRTPVILGSADEVDHVISKL